MLIRGSALVMKFGLSLYIARFLDLSALGLYGLVVGLTLVVPTLLRAGLTSSITRTLVNADTVQMVLAIRHYLAWVGAAYIALLVGLCITILVWPLAEQRVALVPLSGISAVLVLLVIAGEHACADLSLLFSNLCQTQRANALGLVQTATSVLPFCALSYHYPVLRSIDALLLFWALGVWLAALVFSLAFWSWPWRSGVGLSRHWFRAQAKASAYLYLSDLTGTVAQFADRYLIAILIDIEHAGVYTLFFQLTNAVYTLVATSIVNMHRPGVLSAFQKQLPLTATARLRSLQKRAIGSMVLLSLAVGASFYLLAPLLQRPLVLQYLPLMWLTFVATAIKIGCLTSFLELFARHWDRSLFLLNLLILGLVVGGCYAFIPWLGVYGIPLSTGLVYLLALLAIGSIVHRGDPRLLP